MTNQNKNTDKPKVSGTITTANCPEDFVLTDLVATMKVRGNYTSNYQKKPFQINFDKKQNLFGLNDGNKYKKWVLLADVKDASMMRNALAFYLGGTLLDEYFCPTFTPVHFYINDEYWGMYLLADQKETGTGRVEITEAEKNYEGTDIGYFFEYDCYWQEEAAKEDGDPTFSWNDSDYVPQKITARAPGEESAATGYTVSSKVYGDAQVPFLKNHLKNCYTVIYNAVFNNRLQEINTVEGVESLVDSAETDMEAALAKTIDIDSFVNMYILNEICCDADVGHSSFYLSFDNSATGNKLLTLTCPWDWDSSLGLKNNVVEDAQSMFASRCSNPWVSMLTNTEWFMKKVQTRWQGLLNKGFFTKALRMIDDYSARYVDDYKTNFDRWPGTMGRNNEVANEVRSIYYSCKTEAEAEALLKSWVTTRFEYLTTAFDGNVPPDNTSGGGGGTPWPGGGDWSFPGGGDWSMPGGGDWSMPASSSTDESSAIARAEAFKEGKTPVKYEAEDATITPNASEKAGTVKSPSNPDEVVSGGKYLGDLNPNAGIGIKFEIADAKAGQALISLRISQRANTSYRFDQFFSMTVNGGEVDAADYLGISLPGGSGTDFHMWTDWDIAIVNLDLGDNVIELTTKNACSNFDYLAIYQD